MDLRIVDGYVDDGVWDQNTVRRLHMTIRGNQVPAFSVANDRLAVAPQPCTNCDRAASDMLLETDAHQHFLAGTLTKTRNARRNRESHCREVAQHCPTRGSGIPAT